MPRADLTYYSSNLNMSVPSFFVICNAETVVLNELMASQKSAVDN